MKKTKGITVDRSLVSEGVIERKIFLIRGKKVMLDKDLATLYGVQTRNLNKAVSRNLDRFPKNFMFQLSKSEFKNLMFQFGTSSWGGTRKRPMAFTDYGILMLSSVLASKRATQVNIQIMRTFIKIKEMLTNNEMLRQKIEELERKFQKHDTQFKVVFEAIREILEKPHKENKKEIGFHAD